MIDMSEIFDFMKSIATPVAAGFAAYTAYKFGSVQAAIGRRQAATSRLSARIAKNKLKLDLFDRRLVIYNAVLAMLARLGTTGGLTSEDEHAYLVGVKGAHWLFEADVVELLEKTIWHQMAHFSLLQSELRDADERTDRKVLSEKKMKSRQELLAQRELMDRMMKPYLKLES